MIAISTLDKHHLLLEMPPGERIKASNYLDSRFEDYDPEFRVAYYRNTRAVRKFAKASRRVRITEL